MEIGIALKKGFRGASKAWKGILIIWLSIFVLAMMVRSPFKSALQGAYGDSMIVEELDGVVNAEAITDLGSPLLISVVLQVVKSSILAYLLMFILTAFFTGGMFSYLTDPSREFKVSAFFKHSSEKFSSFLLVKVLVSLMLLPSIILLYFIFQYMVLSNGIAGKLIYLVLLLLDVWVIVEILAAGDFARARLEMEPEVKGTKAISFGLKAAFRYKHESIAIVLPILLIQFILSFMAMSLVMHNVLSAAVAILLVVQIFVCLKTFVKVWRFGSITDIASQIPRVVTTKEIEEETAPSEEELEPEGPSLTSVRLTQNMLQANDMLALKRKIRTRQYYEKK